MAKQRIPVSPLAPPPSLTPRATPVDTFHRADVSQPTQGPSEMAQLAEALGQFEPALLSISINAKNRDNRDQGIAGTEKVLSDKQLQNRKALKEAVDKGQIPEARNPWFLRAMQEQVGRIEGDNFDVALREAYAQSSAQHGADITDFVGGFTSKYLESRGLTELDPSTATALHPKVEASVANLKAQHVAKWEQEQSTLVRTRLYDEVGKNLDAHLIYSSPEALAADIKTRVDTLVTNGLSGSDANRAVIDAITDKARDTGDRSVLDLLDMVNTGNGLLGNTQYAKDKRYATEENLSSKEAEKERLYWSNRERVKKATSEDLQTQISSRLMADPNTDISDLLGPLAKVDGQAAITARKWKEDLIDDAVKVREDPLAIATLYDQLYSGAPKSVIMEAAAQHKLAPGTVDNAYKAWDIVKAHSGILTNPITSHMVTAVANAAGGDVFSPGRDPNKVIAAQNLMRANLLQAAQDHPEMTSDQVLMNFGDEIQTKVLKLVNPDSGAAREALPKPDKPKAPEAPKPAAPAAAPKPEPQAAPAQPAVRQLYKSADDLKKAIEEHNAAPEGIQTRLELQAEALGLPVEKFILLQNKGFAKPK